MTANQSIPNGTRVRAFNAWVMDLLGWVPGDTLEDFFPGSGGMDRVVAARAGVTLEGQLPLYELANRETS